MSTINNSNSNQILGNLIARSFNRMVYEHKLDSSLVIKVPTEKGIKLQSNYYEHEAYLYLKSIGLDHWVAPCRMLDNGWLLMIKCKVCKYIPKLKEPLPDILNKDLLKPENWGILKKKPVIIDYEYTLTEFDEKYKHRN